MITLDEAIKHCKEVAEEKEREAEYRQETQGDMFKFLDDLSKSVGGEGVENDALNECLECANEHRQLAEWLKDYKRLKEQEPKHNVGEWIKKNNDYFDWYECSECGYGSDGEMKYNRLCDVRTKFCPDCGSQNLKGE